MRPSVSAIKEVAAILASMPRHGGLHQGLDLAGSVGPLSWRRVMNWHARWGQHASDVHGAGDYRIVDCDLRRAVSWSKSSPPTNLSNNRQHQRHNGLMDAPSTPETTTDSRREKARNASIANHHELCANSDVNRFTAIPKTIDQSVKMGLQHRLDLSREPRINTMS